MGLQRQEPPGTRPHFSIGFSGFASTMPLPQIVLPVVDWLSVSQVERFRVLRSGLKYPLIVCAKGIHFIAVFDRFARSRHSLFRIPTSLFPFRLPQSAFRIPTSPFRIPHSNFLIRKAPVQLTRLREQVKDSPYILLSNAMNNR